MVTLTKISARKPRHDAATPCSREETLLLHSVQRTSHFISQIKIWRVTVRRNESNCFSGKLQYVLFFFYSSAHKPT